MPSGDVISHSSFDIHWRGWSAVRSARKFAKTTSSIEKRLGTLLSDNMSGALAKEQRAQNIGEMTRLRAELDDVINAQLDPLSGSDGPAHYPQYVWFGLAITGLLVIAMIPALYYIVWSFA